MPDDDNTLQKALRATGLDSVRLARGVVGNTTYAVCGCFLAIAATAWFVGPSRPELAVEMMRWTIGISAFYLVGTWIFAHFHPGLALLGGAELLKWRAMDMGAKELLIEGETKNVAPADGVDQA